jgi:dihydrofolate reductase
MNGKIILNLAISLDGYIATKNGGFDWIKGDGDKSHDTRKQFSFPEFIADMSIVVMGKRAFLDAPPGTIEMFKSQKVYVTSNEKLDTKYDVEFISGDVVSQILELKKENDKDIWLFGGAGSIDAFVKADVIDEYIVGIIPIILGEGIPLFLKENPNIDLHLTECTIQEGIAILRYSKKE